MKKETGLWSMFLLVIVGVVGCALPQVSAIHLFPMCLCVLVPKAFAAKNPPTAHPLPHCQLTPILPPMFTNPTNLLVSHSL